MTGNRYLRAIAAASLPLALALQSVLALGAEPLDDATPEAPAGPERRAGIDPGFVIRAGTDVDPGFIVVWEDRSYDTGFFAGGRLVPARVPSPSPATPPAPETPAITLGAP